MPTTNTDSTLPAVQTAEEETETSGSYDAVRFNALKHGILSRLAVLPHEDTDEFSELLAALVEEHKPTGPTETHLVEELAGIIWRKRRVLLAEGAAINRGLRSVTRNTLANPIEAAVPLEFGLSSRGTDVRDLMSMMPDEVTEHQRQAQRDLAATQKAAAILKRGKPNAYEKALRALSPDSRIWWQEYVEDEEYPATVEGLAEFIQEHLEPLNRSLEKEARHHAAIKAQTLGDGLQVHRLEKLNRYETHLDRKFERTLAMLVKLREMRSSR